MALLICEQGPLWSALTAALLRDGKSVATARPQERDLFSAASGKQTILYAPAASLLAGTLDPRPSRERMAEVLRAAKAPGVQAVVLLVPLGGGFEEEETLLRHSGKPFVVLRSPPLLDEVAAQVGTSDHEALWVPRAGVAEVTDGERLVAAVLAAIDGDQQGSSRRVAGDILDAPTLFGRAVNLFAPSGAPPKLQVHGVWPPLYRITRRVLKLLGRPEPAALPLWDKLGQSVLAPAHELVAA